MEKVIGAEDESSALQIHWHVKLFKDMFTTNNDKTTKLRTFQEALKTRLANRRQLKEHSARERSYKQVFNKTLSN